jgi:hypothetical protein
VVLHLDCTNGLFDFDGTLADFFSENSRWYRQTLGPDVGEIIGFVIAYSADMGDLAAIKSSF